MSTLKSALIREQLDSNLAQIEALKDVPKPNKGWIRAVREALGMSGRQLAERLDVSPPTLSDMEHAETSESITLRSLHKAARALDCRLVYAFIPNQGLDQAVRKQAEQVALRRLSPVFHTMRLEDQSLSEAQKAKILEEKIEELVRTLPRSLWDRP